MSLYALTGGKYDPVVDHIEKIKGSWEVGENFGKQIVELTNTDRSNVNHGFLHEIIDGRKPTKFIFILRDNLQFEIQGIIVTCARDYHAIPLSNITQFLESNRTPIHISVVIVTGKQIGRAHV